MAAHNNTGQFGGSAQFSQHNFSAQQQDRSAFEEEKEVNGFASPTHNSRANADMASAEKPPRDGHPNIIRNEESLEAEAASFAELAEALQGSTPSAEKQAPKRGGRRIKDPANHIRM